MSTAQVIAHRLGAPRRRLRRRAAAPRSSAEPNSVSSGLSAVAVGECLWDALPAGLFLGGAPTNVAGHAKQLGMQANVVSRVGRDDLGEEACLRLRERGVDTGLIQVDERLPTGFVRVQLADDGQATYDIRQSAWDALEATEESLAAAAAASVVVYGSLAQRSQTGRAAVRALAAAAQRAVFDVNLRGEAREAVLASLSPPPWLLKLNDEEAVTIAAWLSLPRAAGDDATALARLLGERLGCIVVVTAGAAGAALRLASGRCFRHRGCKVKVADTVGSGDAFLAALLHGLLQPAEAPAGVLARACAVGAFVASRQGATPALDWAAIEALQASAPPAEEV